MRRGQNERNQSDARFVKLQLVFDDSESATITYLELFCNLIYREMSVTLEES